MNHQDTDLLAILYLAWIVFNILMVLGIVAMGIFTWDLYEKLSGSGAWSLVAVGAGVLIDALVNIKFAHETQKLK